LDDVASIGSKIPFAKLDGNAAVKAVFADIPKVTKPYSCADKFAPMR
jgi:hypothetical protein